MTKLVNIFPNGPITTINPPIRIRLSKVSMNIADIRKCLIAKAYVEEVLDGNKTIQLTFENYDSENEDDYGDYSTDETTDDDNLDYYDDEEE